MTEIMSKKSGIDSNSFYGNQSYLKTNPRKTKQKFSDENQSPDKKKASNERRNYERTPPLTPPTHLSPTFSSSEKFYSHLSNPSMNLINNRELYRIENGFGKKSSRRQMSRSQLSFASNKNLFNINSKERERDSKFKYNSNIKLNMKSATERTPTFTDWETSETRKEPKSNQKITKFFQKQNSPFIESNENIDINERNSEVKSPAITNVSPISSPKVSPNINHMNNCETPKSWRLSSLERDVNSDPLNSDIQFNGNNESDPQNNMFTNWSESVVFEANTPIGLRNLGNTCYMNSIVQSLFALKFFIEDLEIKFNELKNICEKSNDFCMTRKLLNLYNQYNGLRNRIENSSIEDLNSDLSDLKLCVGQKSSPFLSGSQQDAAEFFNYVIDTIAEEFECCPTDAKNNPIWRNFSFETGGSLVCQKCTKTTALVNERFNALYLSIPEDKSLQTAFDDFLKDETTAHQCSRCGANQNVLSKYLAKRSKVLFLQLARYNQHGDKHTEQVLVPQVIYVTVHLENREQTIVPSPLATPYRSKLQNVSICNRVPTVVRKIDFDNPFDMDLHQNENRFTTEANESDSKIEANGCTQLEDSQLFEEKTESNEKESTDRVKYQLVAVVCHHGFSLSVGHYTCYVYSIENNQWFECDDNRITETDFDCVQRKSQTSGYCYFYVLS